MRSVFTTVVVTVPEKEIASELLRSSRRGLEALGRGYFTLDERGSFCATRGAEARQVLVAALATTPQLLQALEEMGHRVLLVVDEVASVPIPTWKALLSAPAHGVVMAGTTSNCEGTGAALEWKVLIDAQPGLKQKRLVLEEPVRYGRGCPVEALLARLRAFPWCGGSRDPWLTEIYDQFLRV
ncbi:unnamed protein product [Effrenium voratum]|nr:unnamed protein product [Effrenium voratum]